MEHKQLEPVTITTKITVIAKTEIIKKCITTFVEQNVAMVQVNSDVYLICIQTIIRLYYQCCTIIYLKPLFGH